MAIILIRAAILYAAVIFSVRLMGKRQLGELQPTELVIAILISNIATLSLEDTEIPLLRGILPIVALVCFEVLTSFATLKWVPVRRMVSGSPKIIIRNGNVDQEMLRALRFSVDDLMTALRAGGVFSLEEVQFAVVETNGSVSVYQRSDDQPATKADVHAQKPSVDPPQVIAADGKLREHTLHALGLDKGWLDTVLRTADTKLSDVFLMTADSACRYHIVRKEEGIRKK